MRQYNYPHKTLGRLLKTMRQRLQESLGETSDAVEIGVEQLDRFERGSELPSEDILMLLISHFDLADDEANKVWELAGYDRSTADFADSFGNQTTETGSKPMQIMLLALDNRVIYTNSNEVIADQNGVIINFAQNDSSKHAPHTVSRVGMSHAQAEQLVATLQRTLLHQKYLSGPKQLPPPANE